MIAAGLVWYVSDYYHADSSALAAAADENGIDDGVTVRQLSDKAVAFVPENPTAGMVFYPGGKVQPEAYAPLMEQCAQQGILCVLVKPHFNLAIVDQNAAEDIVGQFPDVSTWIIAGHSLGGVVASNYLKKHENDFAGIAFLAAYPTSDLSDYGGRALSIVGTEDRVLKHEKYVDAQSKLPASAHELQIVGGNHAYYGSYGEQAGDGTAIISRAEQQAQTADALVQFAHAA